MSDPSNDLVAQLKRMRYDLTALQAKLSDALELAARVGPTPPRPRCQEPGCGVEMRGTHSLAEHVYLAHAGPVPAHWLVAEEQAVSEPLVEAEA